MFHLEMKKSIHFFFFALVELADGCCHLDKCKISPVSLM